MCNTAFAASATAGGGAASTYAVGATTMNSCRILSDRNLSGTATKNALR